MNLRPFDLLATLVAVVHTDGTVLFANSALEDALGSSRRLIAQSQFADFFTEPAALQNALLGAGDNSSRPCGMTPGLNAPTMTRFPSM